jgi:hypothetical protein
MVDIRVDKNWLTGVQSGIVLMNTQPIHRSLLKPPLPTLGLHVYSGAFVHIMVSTLYTQEPTAGPIGEYTILSSS